MPRGRAQGLRGLATGGRSGMAKRNLAGLAPDFVRDAQPPAASAPQKPLSKLSALAARSSAKRPAEAPPANAAERPRPASPAPSASSASNPAPVAGTSRPSKLAALAAARNASASSGVKPAPVQSQKAVEAVPTETAPKPLSKLQQRMAANRQQREAATPEAIEAAAAAAAEEEAQARPQTCYGSDLPISSLFPTEPSASGAHSDGRETSRAFMAPVSAIAGSAKDATDQLVAPLERLKPVPGGSPFAIYSHAAADDASPQIELVRKAFAGPSPDDVVMKAREGTRLGAK